MPKYKTSRGYQHLKQADRDRIEALLDHGMKQKEIAKVLKVDPGTISRECTRARQDGCYDAETAEHKAQVLRGNSKYQGMKIEGNSNLKAHIITQLRKKRSPDEIAGRMRYEQMSFYASKNAIYKWLYSVYGERYCRYLCTKRRRRRKQKKKTMRVMIPNRVSIHLRPLGATNKTRYGHFEGDTIVAPRRSGNTHAIAIVVERKSKLLCATKIPSLAPRQMTQVMNEFAEDVMMKSITLDNGIENKDHEQWNISRYFADAHSPWQKPHIEGEIGLGRRWAFPKGTDWSTISEERLQDVIQFLNHKWRKSLGYRSAIEVASAHGILKQQKNPVEGYCT